MSFATMGFADSVLDAQSNFRALMDAFAQPGVAQVLHVSQGPTASLPAGLAVVLLTLCDHETPIWLSAGFAADIRLLDTIRLATGAPLVAAPHEASFAFVEDHRALPRLDTFALGTQEYPDRATTVVLAVPELERGPELVGRGPGIRDRVTFAPNGLPEDFAAQWAGNRALFPRGVDLILVAGDSVMALPRSLELIDGE